MDSGKKKKQVIRKPSSWPKMETWQTIPEGYRHVPSGKILSAKEFAEYQESQKNQNVGFIIKAMP